MAISLLPRIAAFTASVFLSALELSPKREKQFLENYRSKLKLVCRIVFMIEGALGVPDEDRLENVRAMTEVTKNYGVYRK